MSKKSRKRNKKILGALAAGLGAMALMKGRGKGMSGKQTISDAQKAHNFAVAPKTDWISKKGSNIADTGSNFQSRFKSKIGNNWVGPGEASGIASRVTDVRHPVLGQRRVPPGGMRTFVGKKGGRVTGAAKRGFGRALMKGKK